MGVTERFACALLALIMSRRDSWCTVSVAVPRTLLPTSRDVIWKGYPCDVTIFLPTSHSTHLAAIYAAAHQLRSHDKEFTSLLELGQDIRPHLVCGEVFDFEIALVYYVLDNRGGKTGSLI